MGLSPSYLDANITHDVICVCSWRGRMGGKVLAASVSSGVVCSKRCSQTRITLGSSFPWTWTSKWRPCWWERAFSLWVINAQLKFLTYCQCSSDIQTSHSVPKSIYRCLWNHLCAVSFSCRISCSLRKLGKPISATLFSLKRMRRVGKRIGSYRLSLKMRSRSLSPVHAPSHHSQKRWRTLHTLISPYSMLGYYSGSSSAFCISLLFTTTTAFL